MTLDNHYTDSNLVALYDLDSGWSEDRDFYLALAEGGPRRILDVGCGTGLLCRAYAERGHQVTGLDPSAPMLDIGRKKPCGDLVQWIEAYAQNFEIQGLFDLIIMTGHAFQTLMTEEDILLTFQSMKKHLHSSGKIVFESRNPTIAWSGRWNYQCTLDSKYGEIVERRVFKSMNDGFLEFGLEYQFPDKFLVSKSVIKFFSQETICSLLDRSGLTLERFHGDWDGGDFKETESEEMIFIVGI